MNINIYHFQNKKKKIFFINHPLLIYIYILILIEVTHTILKALPSKNGKLTLFPGVEYLGGQHYSMYVFFFSSFTNHYFIVLCNM